MQYKYSYYSEYEQLQQLFQSFFDTEAGRLFPQYDDGQALPCQYILWNHARKRKGLVFLQSAIHAVLIIMFGKL